MNFKIIYIKCVFISFIFINVLSCNNKNNIQINKNDNGYLVYNQDDSLEFDQNLNLISSSVSVNDSISKVMFKNDSIISAHSTINNKNYVIWFDSLSNPFYIESEKEIEINQPIGYNIQYGKHSDLQRLIIEFTFVLDGHIKAMSTNQYLEYRNDEIDMSRSSFYIIEKSDSGKVFKIFHRRNTEEDCFYSLIYYSDPFLELSPISKAGNLYFEDTTKIKDELFFQKNTDPFLAYNNINHDPTVYQLYAIENGSGKLIDYKMGIITEEFASEKGLEKVKNEFSHRFNQFKNKSYFKDIERSLERFSFVNFSNGKVNVNKKELEKIIKSKFN